MDAISWGRPKEINVSKLVNGVSSKWEHERNPSSDTTKLTPTAGEELKRQGEGGGVTAYKRGRNSYVFEYQIDKAKGKTLVIPHVDGQVEGYYSVQLIPEDPTVEGFVIDCAAVHVEDAWNSKDGATLKYVFTVLEPEEGAQVKWEVQESKVTPVA